ncbi:MAG TPA: L,D-transpeptidase family protein [Allosphingosinicella sp.]|nr:L,D-transpeptidase family protein [Allosphingosinicella sp.]
MREAFMALVRRLSVAAFLSLLPLTAAHSAGDVQPLSLTTDVAPGHSVWRDDGKATGPVRILVSLPLQLAFVWRGAALIGISSVSTGIIGRDTPTGMFTILEKDEDHHSNLYDDAPMPWMLRITWDGVALHAGKVTGEPASHGCIRLPAAFARKLYAVADVGTTVSVVDDVPELSPLAPETEAETIATR